MHTGSCPVQVTPHVLRTSARQHCHAMEREAQHRGIRCVGTKRTGGVGAISLTRLNYLRGIRWSIRGLQPVTNKSKARASFISPWSSTNSDHIGLDESFVDCYSFLHFCSCYCCCYWFYCYNRYWGIFWATAFSLRRKRDDQFIRDAGQKPMQTRYHVSGLWEKPVKKN
jgi:hypothetical protein